MTFYSPELNEEIIPVLMQWGLQLFLAIIVLLGFWIMSVLVKWFILRVGNRFKQDRQPVFHLLASMGKTAVFILGVVTSLGSLGINVSALVAGLGLTGFAVSFALKDTLSNILSGILVLIYQPFKIDQTIKVAGHSGKVVKIDLRYTELVDEDKKILLPNTLIFTNAVVVSN